MFNQQQKPAFKFIIRSKLDEEKQKDEQSRDQSIAKPISKLQPSGLLPDRKRKRSDKDNTTSAPPIATKKVVMILTLDIRLTLINTTTTDS